MKANGFGLFVPFGSVLPGTLFLDCSSHGAGGTAILMKVSRFDRRHNFVRIFDKSLKERDLRFPALGSVLMADQYVIALPDHFIEVANRVDNVVWESDPDFAKVTVCADAEGSLLLKAFCNRHADDYECDLFDLASGANTTLDRASVGFRRWSVTRRDDFDNRDVLYNFEA